MTDEKTSNLSELIRGQNSKKKKRPVTRRPLFSKAPTYSSSSTNRVYVRRNTSTNYGSNQSRFSSNARTSTYNSNKMNGTSNNYNRTRSTATRTASMDKENGDSKFFDVRIQNNSNLRVIESKASDYDQSSQSISSSSFKRSPNNKLTNSRSKNYKSKKESKLNIQIRDDETVNYKIELNRYTKDNQLPSPRYVLSNYIEKGKVIAYFSKVQIGNRSWLIFPDYGYRTGNYS